MKKAAAKAAKKPALPAEGPRKLVDEAFDGPPMYFCAGHVPAGVKTTAKINPKENVLPPVCEVCGRVFEGYQDFQGTFLDLEALAAELTSEAPVEFDDGTYAQVAYIGEFEDTFPSGEVYPPGSGDVTRGEQKLDQLLGDLMARELATLDAYFVSDEEGTLWAVREIDAPKKAKNPAAKKKAKR
jgi:hypothetical protein